MKKIFAMTVAIVMTMTIAGCNKQIIDTTFAYDRAILGLPNGETVEGEIQSWTDYEDGDQIQVKIDGVTYLVHSEDVVLIAE